MGFKRSEVQRINRTSVELKQETQNPDIPPMRRINRTSVELKLLLPKLNRSFYKGINRTSVELKQIIWSMLLVPLPGLIVPVWN